MFYSCLLHCTAYLLHEMYMYVWMDVRMMEKHVKNVNAVTSKKMYCRNLKHLRVK